MRETGPTRGKSDLADMVEMLLDKGVVINADIAVSVGDTQLLGIEVRAAIASFETAAKYGLEFPAGTDEELIEQAASGRTSLATGGDDPAESTGGETGRGRPRTPTPEVATDVVTAPGAGDDAAETHDSTGADGTAENDDAADAHDSTGADTDDTDDHDDD